MSEKDPHRYDDIIDLPHFVSKDRRHMSNYDRAAQFAPFDALTGYDEAIEETGRTTENEIVLGDHEMEVLEQKFQILLSRLNERPLVKIRYFIPDLYKDGGSYKEEEVIVRRIDMNRRILISEDKKSYDLAYIVNVSSDLFDDYDF
ncbi:MAG: hypothetical protein IIY76_00335 [Erysipelotrichaceae bacterium]|nr:hypothetical protein [Erysipelotrichaceae bacterium]